ncbi:hypothetical protein CW745_08745 [Psychromonas sp. psych-6C06]|uniref:hypothetical protein n=1 Tax=Psychromonas sp. psych-6C06 TaxID=2058089 RepID=UPI000C343B95|nr:hypothetical protein [Psychromonas sp. psych-6C06]PKF61415.1 hypothetical protein CW745_08745 [Psychromonas sp. psych-6C06]
MSDSLPYERFEQVQLKIHDLLKESVTNTLLENRIPLSVADKLARQVATNFDLAQLYLLIEQNIQDTRFPKQRILDRTIVHMFEELYRTVNSPSAGQIDNEFFSIVPRGECLDLFLQLVKEYCMGDAEIEKHTHQIEPIIERYKDAEIINWEAIYASDDFKVYLDGLLTLILSRLRKDQKPIPALENKMPLKYQPYRINSFLNQVCLMWEKQQ